MHFSNHDPNRINATLVPDVPGLWTIHIDAWPDPMATWRNVTTEKFKAGQNETELANDLETGAALFGCAAADATAIHRNHLRSIAAGLCGDGDLRARTTAVLLSEARAILQAHPVRDLLTRGRTRKIRINCREALCSSWYEFFPHSNDGYGENDELLHGTFKTAVVQLNHTQRVGFDMVYLPPIHPIGEINRKGRSNTLTPEPGGVGSPWTIDSAEGGYDAIHPSLGDEKDFKELIKAAKERDLKVAIDLTLQCTPDHPWAETHPEWFTVLPDGIIAYAGNPPRKYQDIYPLDFDNNVRDLYIEVLRIVKFWVERGVKVSCMGNPHTEPGNFWKWLIETIHETNPEIIFLAETFTAPARLYGLAKAGFARSYIYFSWETTKEELAELGEGVTRHTDITRPSPQISTPDILHDFPVKGSHGAFATRAAPASTLSPLWGMYSGSELFESVPVRGGSEEYLGSERYQLRSRDYDQALAIGNSLEPFIATLNKVRREHPALQRLRNLHFHDIDNGNLLAYSKLDPVTGDTILVVLSLDPWNAQEAAVHSDIGRIGLHNYDRMDVTDLIIDDQFNRGKDDYVRLAPWENVVHILKLPEIDVKLHHKSA